MKVLVTGASGLLGGAVAADLVARGHEVVCFQRTRSGVAGAVDVLGSVTDPAAVERLLVGADQTDGAYGRSDHASTFDGVVHLAAKVSLAGAPDEFVAVNVEGTRTLLDAARRGGVRRFVFVSSPSVAHSGSSLVGEDAGPADPLRAHGDYARTKARAELLALAADAPGFSVVAVRPHLVWGPGDTQLVARIVERARRGRLPLLGHGAALIDTTYIDNAATAITAALGRAEIVHGNSYVVTNGEPRPVAELLAGICRAGGAEPPAWSVPAGVARAAGAAIESVWAIRPGEDEPPMTRFLAEQLSTAHWFDQRRTRLDLAWTPGVTLDEGFARLADSYRTI